MSINIDERLEKLEYIGEHQLRDVYKYRDKTTGKTVAIRRLYLTQDLEKALRLGKAPEVSGQEEEEDGVPYMTIRQVSLHKLLDHDNVSRLLHLDYDKDNLVRLVLEYDGVDLKKFQVEDPQRASDPKLIKKLLYQLLCGVAYYHSIGAAHGFLNPLNVLIDNSKDEVKLQITNLDLDIDPYNKAPELLLGSDELTPAADMFSVGCIFSEMLLMRRLFSSSKEIVSIFRTMGTPNEENWPGVTELYKQVSDHEGYPPMELSEVFPQLEPAGVDLLSKLLCLNPSKRITATDALKHCYFDEQSVTDTAAQASSSAATTSQPENSGKKYGS